VVAQPAGKLPPPAKGRAMPFDASEHPHRRFNPLTGDWVLVSPHRLQRPWQGQQERPAEQARPPHDPTCYLCPGNARAGGARNPDYRETFVFTNDFAALLPDAPRAPEPETSLLRQRGVRGTCRVICFSPRHDRTLAEFDTSAILRVIELWAHQTEELGRDWRWVQVFENKGPQMGASNPHPHGQVWALDSIPSEPAKEDARQRAYLAEAGRPLLLAYAELELEQRQRLVAANDHWLAVVPYWAVWPFEVLVLPARRRVARLPELTGEERGALAELLKPLLVKLDNLFETSFPYSFGWHGAPHQEPDGGHWQLHAHIYPPLLRSAAVRKFMVGFEMLGEPQRDLTAEQAAERLRALSDTHYRTPA